METKLNKRTLEYSTSVVEIVLKLVEKKCKKETIIHHIAELMEEAINGSPAIMNIPVPQPDDLDGFTVVGNKEKLNNDIEVNYRCTFDSHATEFNKVFEQVSWEDIKDKKPIKTHHFAFRKPIIANLMSSTVNYHEVSPITCLPWFFTDTCQRLYCNFLHTTDDRGYPKGWDIKISEIRTQYPCLSSGSGRNRNNRKCVVITDVRSIDIGVKKCARKDCKAYITTAIYRATNKSVEDDDWVYYVDPTSQTWKIYSLITHTTVPEENFYHRYNHSRMPNLLKTSGGKTQLLQSSYNKYHYNK